MTAPTESQPTNNYLTTWTDYGLRDELAMLDRHLSGASTEADREYFENFDMSEAQYITHREAVREELERREA